MGLAAGQARLLSITGRKSDCEFQSMRLSHQKIALARELADLSNEYQNSLNQTKLVYDYYGKGDTSTQLSYGILMNPSALNNYMPTIISDSLGRVTLNSKYAAVARAAGIPQEGLGTLPSEKMREAFIKGLAQEGLITEKLADTINHLPYNQGAGFGGGTTVAVATDSGNVDDLLTYLNESGAVIDINLLASYNNPNQDGARKNSIELLAKKNGQEIINSNTENGDVRTQLNLGDLINGTAIAQITAYNGHLYGSDPDTIGALQEEMLQGIFDQVDGCLKQVLDLGDGYTGKALEYARASVNDLLATSDDPRNVALKNNPHAVDVKYDNVNESTAKEYIGWIGGEKRTGICGWGHGKSKYTIDIGNLLHAYLTYFADYMNGISKTDSRGVEIFDISGQKYRGDKAEKDQIACPVSGSHLAMNNKTFQYTWKIGTEVSSDDLGQSTFYDALFNQICANGWTENDRINDNEYLQQMLQNGMMFISRMKDDNYYYQGNYATDTYIKEIADETLIAYAESKYNTEKAKLNAKEETIDLKMKNLDTEISSLTTEYDTVKNTISKNIEKSFKRYSA